MRFTQKPKLKTILAAVSACLLLLASVGISFGAYNSQAAKRGVVRNRDTEKIRFTSNYLQPVSNENESTFPAKVVAFSEDAVNTTDNSLFVDIYVYNYIVGSNSLINERDITYDLTITIKDGTQKSYTVKDGDTPITGTDNVYEKKGLTLTGRTANSNHFTVNFSGADLDKIKIIAKAVPQDKSATGNQLIAAVISPCTASSVQGFSCVGSFTDISNGNPNEFDAFNYEVSVSGGAANVTLTWNKDVVEIDPFFLKKIGVTTAPTDGALTFQMDQAAGNGTYLIPFYIKDESAFTKKDGTSISWDDMKSIISVTGDQIATIALNP